MGWRGWGVGQRVVCVGGNRSWLQHINYLRLLTAPCKSNDSPGSGSDQPDPLSSAEHKHTHKLIHMHVDAHDTPTSTRIDTHTDRKTLSLLVIYSDQLHWSVLLFSHSILPYETHGYIHTHTYANTHSELGSIAEYHCSDIINGSHCVLHGSVLTTRWLHWPAAAAAALLTARERWKKLTTHTQLWTHSCTHTQPS